MIDRIVRENMKTLVTSLARGTGQSVSALSKAHYGNAAFFAAFFRGDATTSIKKVDEMFEGISAAWPDDLPWPALRAVVLRRPDRARGKLSPRTRRAA